VKYSKIIKVLTSRKCPICRSNKWKWIETLPATFEEISKFLRMRFICEKCGVEFIAEEKARVKVVNSAEKCFNCKSKFIENISKPDADIDLFQCKQCHCYMGLFSEISIIVAEK
jgi:hypothetical protein